MPELIDAINNIKASFDAVQTQLTLANADLASTKAETAKAREALAAIKQDHAGKISELEAKKLAADRSIEENGRRIQLNNQQVNEITRIRKELEDREKQIAAREQTVVGANNDIAKATKALDAREAEIKRKEEEIARRYAKMREAIS